MTIMISIYLFFIGAALTSFLTLSGERVPDKRPITGRSVCLECNQTIDWVSLIPIVGFIIRGGKCHQCGASIPKKYPLLELIGGTLFLGTYLYHGALTPEVIIALLFFALMLLVTASDLAHMIVPNIFLYIGFPIILIGRMLYPLDERLYSLLGALAAFIFLWLIALYGKKRFNTTALGGGDIKLYIIIGLFLELNLVFLSLFFASLIGILFGKIVLKRHGKVPFVPFIFAGSVLAYFIGDPVIDWYLSLFNM